MSDNAMDRLLERMDRLGQAVGDMMESHATQGRLLLRELGALRGEVAAMRGEFVTMRGDLRRIATERIARATRVE